MMLIRCIDITVKATHNPGSWEPNSCPLQEQWVGSGEMAQWLRAQPSVTRSDALF